MLQVVDDHRGDSLFIATSNHPAPHVSAQAQIVELESPDESAPSEILNLKLRSVRHDFDVTAASEQMEGYSAAEVEAIALDAIRLMVRQLDNRSTTEQIAYAIDLGEARRQIVRRSQGKSPSRQLEAPCYLFDTVVSHFEQFKLYDVCMVFDGVLSRRPLTASERDQELFAMVPALDVLRDAEKFGFNVYLGGGPGSGKTTLLRRFEYEHCGAAVFVRAEPAGSATKLLEAVAAAVGPQGAAPVSMSDTELDVATVFEALDRWQEVPGRPRVVLVDGADDEQIRLLFGRYRDSMWDLPLTWVVASRGAAPPPPADSFLRQGLAAKALDWRAGPGVDRIEDSAVAE